MGPGLSLLIENEVAGGPGECSRFISMTLLKNGVT